MDKMKIRIFAFMLAIIALGAGITVAGFSDVKCVISGKTVHIGSAEQREFHETAIAEGEAFYIQGPFATYEQTTTRFGVPTGKTETFYYIVLNMTRDDFIRAVEDGERDLLFNGFYFVYAVTNKDKVAEADAAVKECEAYAKRIMKNYDFSDVPDIHLKIDGKLMKQPKDSEYKKIRDNCFSASGIDSVGVADLMVRDGKPGGANVAVFSVGVLLMIAPVVILIVLFVKKKREEAAQELW